MKFRKCLNCGANLKVNKKLELKYCEYCGEEYLFEEFINIEKSNINSNNKNPELVKQKRDFLEESQIKQENLEEKNKKEHKTSLDIKKQILKESIKKYMDFKNGKATADINEDKLEQTLKENFFWAENPDINGLPDSFKKYFNDDNTEKK